jgi:hypothetical protein
MLTLFRLNTRSHASSRLHGGGERIAMGSVSGSESQRNNAIPGRVQVKVTTEEDTKRDALYVDFARQRRSGSPIFPAMASTCCDDSKKKTKFAIYYSYYYIRRRGMPELRVASPRVRFHHILVKLYKTVVFLYLGNDVPLIRAIRVSLQNDGRRRHRNVWGIW